MDGLVATFSSTGASPAEGQENQFIVFGGLQGLTHTLQLSPRATYFPFPIIAKRIIVRIVANTRSNSTTYSVNAGGTDYASVTVPAGTNGIFQTTTDDDRVIPANTEMAFHRVFGLGGTGAISNVPCMALLVTVGS